MSGNIISATSRSIQQTVVDLMPIDNNSPCQRKVIVGSKRKFNEDLLFKDTSESEDDNPKNVMFLINIDDIPILKGAQTLENLRQSKFEDIRKTLDKIVLWKKLHSLNTDIFFDSSAIVMITRMLSLDQRIPINFKQIPWLEWPIDELRSWLLKGFFYWFQNKESFRLSNFQNWILQTKLLNFTGVSIAPIAILVNEWESMLELHINPFQGFSHEVMKDIFLDVIQYTIQPNDNEQHLPNYLFMQRFAQELKDNVTQTEIQTFDEFCACLFKLGMSRITCLHTSNSVGMLNINNCVTTVNSSTSTSAPSFASSSSENEDNISNEILSQPSEKIKRLCFGCGRIHAGGSNGCNLKNHPDWNHENKPWRFSTKGKAWKQKHKYVLPRKLTLK